MSPGEQGLLFDSSPSPTADAAPAEEDAAPGPAGDPGGPLPDPEGLSVTSLASGSSGNCFAVSYRGEVLLVDAGLSFRKTRLALEAAGLEPARVHGLVLTHEHADHVAGAGPVARKLRIPVHASAGTWKGAARRLGKLPPPSVVVLGTSFRVGPFTVHSFPTFHDAREACAYVVEAPDGSRVGVLTDIGALHPGAEERLEGCGALLLEFNHDREMLRTGPYPWHLKQRIAADHGHLANDAAAQLVTRLVPKGLRAVLAAHLSETNNSPEVVRRAFRDHVSAEHRRVLRFSVAPRRAPSDRVTCP